MAEQETVIRADGLTKVHPRAPAPAVDGLDLGLGLRHFRRRVLS